MWALSIYSCCTSENIFDFLCEKYLDEHQKFFDKPMVSKLAHGSHVTQDGYECGPTQSHKFTWNIMRVFFVVTRHNVFNV